MKVQQLAQQHSLEFRVTAVVQSLTHLMSSSGRVDSMVIDSDVTNYTLSSLFPAMEYEISLSAVKESQESDVVHTSVFTGRPGDQGHQVRKKKSQH